MAEAIARPAPSAAARRTLAALLGSFAFYIVLVLAMPGSLPHRGLIADLCYLPFPLFAALLWRQVTRTAEDPHRRTGLHLLFVAQLFGTVNQLAWVLDSAGFVPGDSPAFEIAGLAMTVSTAVGLLYLVPGRGVAGSTPVVPRIDASLLALACFSVGWHFVGEPALRAGSETGGEFIWLATVTAGDLFTALIALSAWAFVGQRLQPGAALTLAAGLGLTAFMDIWLEVQTLAGTYRSGGGVDMVFGGSIVLIGVAAYLEQRPAMESNGRGVRRAIAMRLFLPGIAAAAIIVPMVAQAAAPDVGPERFVPSALLVLFVILMQVRFMALERAAERAVTTRLALERDLRLSQQFESLGRYAASVAHDMSNLLAALVAQVHVLRMIVGNDGAPGERLGEMERTLGSGATLSRRLMQMSRGGTAEQEPVDLTRAARNLALTVRRLMPDNVHLALECDTDPVVVALRPGDVDQVLLNLVINSRDALPRGGRITVRVHGEQGRAELTVEDDGVGIAPQVLGRIFEPFFTTRGDRGGTGLGLATVKSIVSQSGGAVDVRSEPDAGTRFSIHWPLAAS